MRNYYEFNYLNDKESFEYFNSLSTNILKNILSENFDYIEDGLNNMSTVFITLFKGKDYNEFYDLCLCLIEELNNIKIILNILKEKNKHE